MSLRMYARRTGQISTGTGSDQVMVGMSLPKDTVVHDIKVNVSMMGVQDDRTRSQACFYAVEGWILPIFDPDAETVYDTLWDTLVPKDSDVEAIDLDTAASDASPFYEPGEHDFTKIFDIGNRPEKVYGRYRMLTMANGALNIYQDVVSPYDHLWLPGDRFSINVKRRLRIREPSVLLFGIANPTTDDLSSTLPKSLAEEKWGQVMYMGEVLHRAMLHLLGLTETGAETPFEEASALLKEHLEPDVYTEDSGVFVTQGFTVYTEMTVDHSVPGMLKPTMLSSGR